MKTSRLQTGLSLVELMIALAIGLFVMLVVGQIFLSLQTSYRVQEAMSRLQENGRFALELLARDIRMAGYQGCARTVPVNNIAQPTTSSWVSFTNAVMGYDTAPTSLPAGLVSSEVKAGTDIIMIQYADPLNITLTGNLNATNANIQVTQTSLIATDDILFITDCAQADVFRANSVSNGAGRTTITHSQASNTSNNLSKNYQTDAEITKLATNIYYVQNDSSGVPILYRKALSGPNLVASDLVEGVEDIQILYGVDTDSDQVANKYVIASSVATAEWANVVSVQVSLLMRTTSGTSDGDRIATAPQTYTYNGTTTTPTDRRIRRVFTTVVNLRNKTS